MGEIFRQGAELMEGYYDAFYDETRLAGKDRAEDEEMTGVAALEKDLLQRKIARPISAPASLLPARCSCRGLQRLEGSQ